MVQSTVAPVAPNKFDASPVLDPGSTTLGTVCVFVSVTVIVIVIVVVVVVVVVVVTVALVVVIVVVLVGGGVVGAGVPTP